MLNYPNVRRFLCQWCLSSVWYSSQSPKEEKKGSSEAGKMENKDLAHELCQEVPVSSCGMMWQTKPAITQRNDP